MNVLITGGARGFGAHLTRCFTTAGHTVCILSRSPPDAALVSGADGGGCSWIECDVGQSTAVPGVMRKLRERWGRLDCLINNAGVQGPAGRSWEIAHSDLDAVFRVNVLGPIALCNAAVPWMIESGGGSIINLSGGGAAAPRPNFSPYAASKAALVRYTETLAAECRDLGIAVNAVAPGAMNTGMLDEILKAGPRQTGEKEYREAQQRAASGGTDPRRAAELCLYLAQPSARSITGRLISAVWDRWEDLHTQTALPASDIYTLRRIVPKDRGQAWGEP